MYKRLFYAMSAAFAVTLVFAVFVAMDAYADRPITVYVDGQKVNFTDAKPFFKDGRIYVPIRFVSEALGAQVTRDAKTNSVYITSAKQSAPPTPPDKPQQQQATIGQVVAFSNAQVKITSVEYGDDFGTFVPFSNEKFALIHLDVYVTEAPKYHEYWTGVDFIDAIILDTGQEIRGGYFTTGEESKLEVGKWQSAVVAKSIGKEREVTELIIRDPISNETARITVQ